MDGSKKIKKNTFYNILKTTSTILFPLITFPYISRVLGPTNIGIINFSNSIISYVTLLASLGVSTYGIRECAKRINEKSAVSQTASEIFSINMCSTIVAYILLFCMTICVPKLFEKSTAIFVLSLSIFATTIGCDWINTAYEDLKYVALRTFVFQIISVILMFVFVKEPDDYMKYIYISVFACSGGNVLNVFYRRRYCKIRFTTKMKIKTHLKSILTVFVLTLSQNIFSNLDITMIGFFRNDYEVGLYSTSVKIYTIISTLITAISVVVIPKLSKAYNDKDKEKITQLQKYAFGYIVTLGIPCIFGINILAKEIIQVIAGTEYVKAAVSLRVLSIALLFAIIGGGFLGNILLLPSGNEKIYMIATLVATILNSIFNIIFIPRNGIVSAAWTTVVSEAVIFIILAIKVDGCYIENVLEYLKAPIVAGMIFIPIKYAVKSILGYNLLLYVCTTIALCIILYVCVLYKAKNKFFISLIKVEKRSG